MAGVVNWLDPCERASALREAYFELLSGQALVLVRYRQLEEERETRYHAADQRALLAELRNAERECAGSGSRVNTVRLHSSKGLAT